VTVRTAFKKELFYLCGILKEPNEGGGKMHLAICLKLPLVESNWNEIAMYLWKNWVHYLTVLVVYIRGKFGRSLHYQGRLANMLIFFYERDNSSFTTLCQCVWWGAYLWLDLLYLKCHDTRSFIILFKRAFKMMKNGVYFIVIELLVAELFKILMYAN